MFLLIVAWLALCSNHIAANPARASKRFIGFGGQTASGIPFRTNQSSLTPARLNIVDLEKDSLQWSLWIQSLIRMQSAPDSSYISYYQLAGVHGRPYIPWNNVEQTPGAQNTGYCEHNSVLFLPWHRPYLAFYEDVLAAHAQDIVDSYSTDSQPTWQAAADLFRIPYWDWGTSSEMPDVMFLPTIQIVIENGNKTVDNPLHQYTYHSFPLNATEFPSSSRDGGDYWLANYSYTVRGLNVIGGVPDIDQSNRWLVGSDLMRNTWYALTKPQSFNEFGTTATQGASIEAIHNNIHGCIGGYYGHMSIFSYSAFDSIFWLHHANVDRLFALWQAVNPDSYVAQIRESSGTFTIASNTLVNASTPLEPWTIGGDGPYYTSDSSRSLTVFSYTYPELQGVPADQLKSSVSAQINKLYNPSDTFTKRDDTQNTAAYTPGAQVREWAVGLEVNKNDLSGDRFIVRVFLGDVMANSRDWAMTSNLAGSFSVFPPPSSPNGSFPEILAYSEVSLVRVLTKSGIDGSDVQGVRKYLRHMLRWRVQKFDATIVHIEQVPSLRLTVEDTIVTLGNDITELPTYGTKTLHPDITMDKSGAH